MLNFIKWLDGKKAYLLGLVAIIYALSGLYLGKIDSATAMDMIWAGLTAIALRAGIKKSGI